MKICILVRRILWISNTIKKLTNLYESVRSQRRIPKEIIIPVYDMLYKQGEVNLSLNDLFEVCLLIVEEDGVQSLEDFKNWIKEGNKIELTD